MNHIIHNSNINLNTIDNNDNIISKIPSRVFKTLILKKLELIDIYNFIKTCKLFLVKYGSYLGEKWIELIKHSFELHTNVTFDNFMKNVLCDNGGLFGSSLMANFNNYVPGDFDFFVFNVNPKQDAIFSDNCQKIREQMHELKFRLIRTNIDAINNNNKYTGILCYELWQGYMGYMGNNRNKTKIQVIIPKSNIGLDSTINHQYIKDNIMINQDFGFCTNFMYKVNNKMHLYINKLESIAAKKDVLTIDEFNRIILFKNTIERLIKYMNRGYKFKIINSEGLTAIKIKILNHCKFRDLLFIVNPVNCPAITIFNDISKEDIINACKKHKISIHNKNKACNSNCNILFKHLITTKENFGTIVFTVKKDF